MCASLWQAGLINDQFFVKAINRSSILKPFVIQNRICLCVDMGLSTVAEGVETLEQLELMKEMGCEQIQGYYFSRPLPADDFHNYYRAHS